MQPTGTQPMSGLGGGFGESQMEELAQSVAGQKSGSSQSSASNISPAQTAATGKTSQAGLTPGAQPLKPREVGSFAEELIKRPLADIATGLKLLFDINALLGVKPAQDNPEEQAKKKQLHQRFNQLTQEEQAYAQQKYQQEMQNKQQEEQERQMRKQQAEQAKAQAIAPPSSPQRGEQKPSGSRKAQAMQQLKDDRTKTGKIQGAF